MKIGVKKEIRFLKLAVVGSIIALLAFTGLAIAVNGEVTDVLVENFFDAFKVEAACTTALRVFEYFENPKKRQTAEQKPDEKGGIG